MEENLLLKEVCIKYNVSRRAIQGYEANGLLVPSGKNKYGYLYYDQEAQERIHTIKQYQDFGFSIKEIKKILILSNQELKSLLIQKKEELLLKQATLELTLISLQDLINSL